MTLVKSKKVISLSSAPGGDTTALEARVTNLEDAEYKITYYEIVSGTSGTVTLPSGATINAGEFGDSGNSILSKINVSNKPTYETPKTSGGIVVTANLNPSDGTWVTSGTFTDASVALIYSIKIKGINLQNLNYDRIIESVDINPGISYNGGDTNINSPSSSGNIRIGNNSNYVATFNSAGLIIGTSTTPLAWMDLPQGTSTKAPFKLNSSALKTSNNLAGDFQFLTDKYYVTLTTSTSVKELTLNDIALTSGRIPHTTTNGRLIDSPNLTFVSDILTVAGNASKIRARSFGTSEAGLELTNSSNQVFGGLQASESAGGGYVYIGSFLNGFNVSFLAGNSIRMKITASTGNVGIGTTNPTSILNLGASTLSAASLRINSGVAPTSPNEGDIWFDGADIYVRVGGINKTIQLL